MSVNSKMTAIADAIRAKTGKTAPLTLDQMVTEIEGITGGTKLFAAIGVTYPAGSTLTCTNGTKTLKAKTTSGQWVFAIPTVGTWTVACTDGTESASEAVAITTEGQSVKIDLSYNTYYYNLGDTCDASTGGWGAVCSYDYSKPTDVVKFNSGSIVVGPVANKTRVAAALTKKAIDLSKINTLYIDCLVSANEGSAKFGIKQTVTATGGNQTNVAFTLDASKALTNTTRQTIALDVSSCASTYQMVVQTNLESITVYSIYGKK